MRIVKRDELIDSLPAGTLFMHTDEGRTPYLLENLKPYRTNSPGDFRRIVMGKPFCAGLPWSQTRWTSKHCINAEFVVLDANEEHLLRHLVEANIDLTIGITWNPLNNAYTFNFEGDYFPALVEFLTHELRKHKKGSKLKLEIPRSTVVRDILGNKFIGID